MDTLVVESCHPRNAMIRIWKFDSVLYQRIAKSSSLETQAT